MNDHAPATPDSGDDWLDTALRADGREHRAGYVVDDGFTARVIARLPLPVSLPAWRKRAVFALWAAASVGIALSLPEAYFDAARAIMHLVAGYPVTLGRIAAGVALLGIATWAGTAFALKSD